MMKALEIQPTTDMSITQLWLVDVLADGSVAYRTISKVWHHESAITAAEFVPQDYSHQNLARPRRQHFMRPLVAAGLFDDEANALLNTWERSYFQNPGQRIFFMVPQSWTDAVLPLNISVPVEVNRVMVGRIELVTPAQRALLHRMAQVPSADLQGTKAVEIKAVRIAMTKLRNDPTKAATYNALAGGHGNLDDLGVPVPPIYANFLALGRFRTALVLNSKDNSLLGMASVFSP